MINRNDNVSIVQQCRLLDLHRSGVYYQAAEESEDNLSLIRLIDEIHLNRPFLGVLKLGYSTYTQIKDIYYVILAQASIHLSVRYRLLGWIPATIMPA